MGGGQVKAMIENSSASSTDTTSGGGESETPIQQGVAPETLQTLAFSITDADVNALSIDGNEYVDASTLRSIVAGTSDATTQQQEALTVLFNLTGYNSNRCWRGATVDTATLNDGVVIPIKIDSSWVSSQTLLFVYLAGVLFEGGESMYIRTVNENTYVCVKWQDIANEDIIGGDGSGDFYLSVVGYTPQ